MIYKCGLCEKVMMGKPHSKLRYKALSEEGKQEEYEMRVCKNCTEFLASGATDGRPNKS